MGGDNAPFEVIDGAYRAAKDFGVNIILVGDGKVINSYREEKSYISSLVTVAHAEDAIGYEDDATSVIKRKKNSSMAVGLKMLSNDEGDAFVSAGNTGALISGATLIVKRIKGVRRAALAPVIPTQNGFTLMLDAGATSDCKPQFLQQFGIMGSVYMKKLYDMPEPRVGLINIGVEDNKGGEVAVEANKLLKKTPVNYVGNIESRELLFDAADVAVCDGFTGNIILKLIEGAAAFFFGNIKRVFESSVTAKLAAAVVMGSLREFKKSMDYTEHGGAPLLGISKPVIKAHGSSDANAFYHAIRQAVKFTQTGVIEEITEYIKEM